MSLASDETEVDESWKVNLEIALLEDADVFKIREICSNRQLPDNLRADVWRICLRLDAHSKQMIQTDDDLSNLQNYDQLCQDCEKTARQIVDSMSNDQTLSNILSDSDGEDDDDVPHSSDEFKSTHSVAKIAHNFEYVLTNFANTYSMTYSPRNGWLSILKILFQVFKPTEKMELYCIFISFYHRFIATGTNVNQCLCSVFRLLLQYHEPMLGIYLDSVKLGPETYLTTWLSNIFADVVSNDVLLSLWDIYILKSDPFVGLLIALVLVINSKSVLISQSELNGGDDEQVNNVQLRAQLVNLPKPLKCSDLPSLFELTETFVRNTPASFRAHYSPLLYGNVDLDSVPNLVLTPLCMMVQIHEILEAQSLYLKDYGLSPASTNHMLDLDSELRYLLVDCRPAEQYNAGHLPSAFFLDSSLILSEPEQFQQSVQFLLSTQERSLAVGSSAAGKHIAFLSSGHSKEDQLANLAIAEFLRLHTPYVSFIEGGYQALHDAFGPVELERLLIGHDPCVCLCCSNASPVAVPSQLVDDSDKIDVSKSRPTEGRLLKGLISKFQTALFKPNTDYNLTASNRPVSAHSLTSLNKARTSPKVEHPRAVDAVNKSKENVKPVAYRNTASVFSIDDHFDNDNDDDDEDDEDAKNSIISKSFSSDKVKSPTDGKKATDRWFHRWTNKSPKTADATLIGDVPMRPAGLDCCEPGDLIDTTQWSRRSEVRGVFDCRFFKSKHELGDLGYLVLSDRHLIMLRCQPMGFTHTLMNSVNSTVQSLLFRKPTSEQLETSGESSSSSSSELSRHAIVIRCIPLSIIVRITSNRQFPECITFHYQIKDMADLLKINSQVFGGVRDRIFIAKAGEAVKMVKMAVFHSLNALDD